MVDKEYLKGGIDVLKKYFSSVSIEVMPLDEEDYKYLAEDGLDGLTVYQETYDEKRYEQVHLSGEKRNFKYRGGRPPRFCILDLLKIHEADEKQSGGISFGLQKNSKR